MAARRALSRACVGAARRLDRIAAEHEHLTNALAAFDRAVIEAGEAEDHLAARQSRRCRSIPRGSMRIETRLFDLRALARKHQVPADDLADLAAKHAANSCARIDAGEAGLAEIGGVESAVAKARASLSSRGCGAERRPRRRRRPAR